MRSESGPTIAESVFRKSPFPRALFRPSLSTMDVCRPRGRYPDRRRPTMPAGQEGQNGHPGRPNALRGGGWPLLLVLASLQFTHILDFMILMPLGPRLLRELDITPRQFGLLVSAYAFGACAAGLLAASWVDRFDRKRALLGLYAGFPLATLPCAL